MIILYQGDDGWLGYQYEPSLDKYTIHTEIYKWSLSKVKKFLNIFADALLVLEQLGIKEVYSVCFTDKAMKFNQFFGFQYVGEAITEDHQTVHLMRFENVWK